MESKMDLVNTLVYRLADRVDMPIGELKAAIEISMFEYKLTPIISKSSLLFLTMSATFTPIEPVIPNTHNFFIITILTLKQG